MEEKYLKRKIDKWLMEWKNTLDKKPALITGIRQCGKTKSIKEFASIHYKNLVEVNFWTHPEYIEIFEQELEVDTIISNISLRFPNIIINPKDTLIFFDEIQDCPRARLSFKNFANDNRYDVIGSGSFLGINGYKIGDTTPVPTGYEENYQMNTMDFEEFMWANDVSIENISLLESYYLEKKEIPSSTHQYFKNLFLKYICIGGFPEAVQSYLINKNIMDGIRIVQNNIQDMKGDFGRRMDKNNNPLFKPSEIARIQSAFELIPTFLAKENKRFITSKIIGGKSNEKVDAIEYLKQAHIVEKVYNLENVSLPLLGNKINFQYKLFPTDIGIVSSMYGIDTIIAINNGDLGQAKGAIYEMAVFDSLYKSGIDCFYFAKETGLEIDFVICYNGIAHLLETKAKNGNTKSAKTVMNNTNHYGKCKLIKIGDYNIGEKEDILTIPHYMVYMLAKFRKSIIN